MFHNKQNESMLSTFVLPISLVCLFALSALVLTFLGSGNYKHIKANYDATSDATVAVSYLTTKVRQNNRESAVSVVHGEEGDRLEILEHIEDKAYRTVIYCQDGTLYESTFSEGQPGGLEANAMRIAELGGLRVSTEDGRLLNFEVKGKDGNVHTFSQSVVGADSLEAGDAQ